MYEFQEEFLTGIDQIDAEHRRLFEIADELYTLKCEEFMPDKYDHIRQPSARRSGLAGFPVPLSNSPAYLRSNSSHGILSAILTQRFAGSICRPRGWLKSRKVCCEVSDRLYMLFCSFMQVVFYENCKKNEVVLLKTLHLFYHKML